MLVTDDSRPKDQGMQRKTIAILVTVGAHVALALFLAVQQLDLRKPPEPELIAQVLGPEESQRPKIQKQSIQRQVEEIAAAAPMMTQVIRSKVTAVTAVPEMTNLNTPIGLGQGNLGVGFGSAKTNRLGSGAMFFGQKVQGKLGVVFDVSASMTEYIPIVVDELQRNFRNATVVCVNSSAFTYTRGEGEAYPYAEAEAGKVSRPRLRDSVAKKMHEGLLSLPNCWFMEISRNSLSYAVEYLMRQDVGVIFVFSDFHDSMDENYLKGLAARVQVDPVTIQLQALAPLEGSYLKGREPLLRNLATSSGGRYVEGELLKRAGR